MRVDVIKKLKAMGVKFPDDATDAELEALLKDAESKETKEAINAAVNAAIKPLAETITALKAELATNSDKELTKWATQAAPLMGLEVDEAKAMSINSLHKVLAKHGVVVGNVIAANHQSPQDKAKEDICLEPWNKETK